MSDWWYVAIAYTIVWASLALYALLLARRVMQAHDVTEGMQGERTDDEDSVVCDAPPAP